MHPLFHYAEIRIKSSGRLIHIRKRLFHDKERTFYQFCCLYFSGDAVLPGYHRHFQRIPAARRYLGKYHLIPPDFRRAFLYIIVHGQPAIGYRIERNGFRSGFYIPDTGKKNTLSPPLGKRVRNIKAEFLYTLLILPVSAGTCYQRDTRSPLFIGRTHTVEVKNKSRIINLFHRTANTFNPRHGSRMPICQGSTQAIGIHRFQMKRYSVGFR